MKVINILLFAFIAFQSVFAADIASITGKLQAVDSACGKVSQLNANIKLTTSVALAIEADVVAIISAFASAQTEITAFVGTFVAADANALIAILVDIEAEIRVGIQVLLAIQAGVKAIGQADALAQNLADLQVTVNAFVGVFLGKCPSASKNDASTVCKKLQNDCKTGCTAYSSCTQ